MTNVKLKAALPKDDENNGLGAGAVEDFLADPKKPRVGIVVLQAKGEHKDYANGTRQPEVSITRIELITDADEADDLIKRAQVLSEKRTGNTPLQIVEDEGDALGFDDDEFDGGDAA